MNSSTSQPALPRAIENRDYVVRKDGAWVFTKEYLLARGTCCESKCTNCPYEYSREALDRSTQRPVISMVPSWTETLINARANVVGRTRFCIHPQAAIHSEAGDIPSFGGTKTLATDAREKFDEVVKQAGGLKPLVVLDKEENPKEFFEFFSKLDCDIAVTHVNDLQSLGDDLDTLALAFVRNRSDAAFADVSESLLKDIPTKAPHTASDDAIVHDHLRAFSGRARQLMTDFSVKDVVSASMDDSLGEACMKASVEPRELDRLLRETNAPILYLIWKDPWMVVRHDTWIAQTLKNRFRKSRFPIDEKRLFAGANVSKYPSLEADEIPDDAILLFSSEPYPFERVWMELQDVPFVARAKVVALVDGERFSWFGIRAIRFLEER